MKTATLLGLLLSLLLANGCATAPAKSTATPPPLAKPSPVSGLLIISAVYGSGVHFADVTARVSELLYQPGVEFFARPEWLNADPTPGWNKALVIVFEYRGQRRIFTSGEGGKVSLQDLLNEKHPRRRKKKN
jgi:hypothetical protein